MLALSLFPQVLAFRRRGGRWIHAHTATISGRAAVLLKCCFPDLIVTITLHDGEIRNADALRSRGSGTPLAWTLSNADHVFYVSERLRRRGLRLTQSQKSRVLYPGVTLPKRTQATERSERGPSIVTVGRLAPGKGHAKLLDVVASLHKENIPVRLEIAGDGPLRAELENRTRELRLQDAVVFRGHVPHRKIYELLQTCNLFVMLSAPEALGIAYLEAMAAGLPVVARQEAGIDELIKHGRTGFTVSADPQEAVDTVRHLLDNPDYAAEVGRQARAFILSRDLTWEGHARQLSECGRALLGSRDNDD